jgi:hypothetical protein
VDAHTFTIQAEKSLNKRCLPIRMLIATVFWDRKEVLMVEFMQQQKQQQEIKLPL